MKEKTKLNWILFFNMFYLVFFTVLSILAKNYEFLYYTVLMGFLIFIVAKYHKKLNIDNSLILGMSILGFLHILGGNFYFSGIRLYDLYFIQNILKYDNLVHMFGSGVITFLIHSMIKPHFQKNISSKPIILGLILIGLTLGVGAFYEIFELIAVIFLSAADAVGDYLNNAFDIVFNLIGAIFATLILLKGIKNDKK